MTSSATERTTWSARRILAELCDADLRRTILAAFWKHGDKNSRELATMQLAKALRFRDQTIRAATAEKKAEWLLARAGAPEFEECLELGLMHYHTAQQKELLAAFLDHWNIPHVEGTIETDDYKAPSRDEVAASANALSPQFGARHVAVYLASLGLLMGESEKEWREATWPVVDEMKARL